MSEEPPATKGMITRTGLAGNVCAAAEAAAVIKKRKVTSRFIGEVYLI